MNTVPVRAVMETNAGDEFHREENWETCETCGRDSPVDIQGCPWGCDE